MAEPWRTPEWTRTGKKVRAAWQALPRLREWLAEHGVDGYPVRHDYPPRISSDKTAHSSPVERAAERLDRIEGEITVTDVGVRAACDKLRLEDFEAWTILSAVDFEGKSPEQAAGLFSCCRGRVYDLLRSAWAFVAWEMSGEGE